VGLRALQRRRRQLSADAARQHREQTSKLSESVHCLCCFKFVSSLLEHSEPTWNLPLAVTRNLNHSFPDELHIVNRRASASELRLEFASESFLP